VDVVNATSVTSGVQWSFGQAGGQGQRPRLGRSYVLLVGREVGRLLRRVAKDQWVVRSLTAVAGPEVWICEGRRPEIDKGGYREDRWRPFAARGHLLCVCTALAGQLSSPGIPLARALKPQLQTFRDPKPAKCGTLVAADYWLRSCSFGPRNSARLPRSRSLFVLVLHRALPPPRPLSTAPSPHRALPPPTPGHVPGVGVGCTRARRSGSCRPLTSAWVFRG
jgi:hypothetical protein